MSLLTNQSAVNADRSFWALLGSGGGGTGVFNNVTVASNTTSDKFLGNGLSVSSIGVVDSITVGSNVFANYLQGTSGTFVNVTIDENLNVQTINGSAYPPSGSGRGVGATVDVGATITSNAVPQYFGQNQYFNVNVGAFSNPQMSIDPGGTVGGNYIAISQDAVGGAPLGIYALGSPIDVINPNSQQVSCYLYSGGGASLNFSGWHRLGSPATSILNDSMASHPLTFVASNAPAPVSLTVGDYLVQAFGGSSPNMLSFSGYASYQSGVKTNDDYLLISIGDSAPGSSSVVGGVLPLPSNAPNPIHFSFSGCVYVPSGTFRNVNNINYQVVAGSNVVYQITVGDAVLQQL